MEQNEFSRLLNVADVVKQGKVEIKATAEECIAVAERFEFDQIDSLELEGTVKQLPNSEDYVLNATVKAVVHVTYDDGEEDEIDVDEEIEVFLVSDIDEDDEELEGDCEIIEDGCIDFGEIASQYVCMMADPIGSLISLEEMFNMMNEEAGEDGEKSVNPFSELRAQIEAESKKVK